tara:strand:- start:351 stop:602 length:252 start_codon:yes stop_codon:yes gene_type:complete
MIDIINIVFEIFIWLLIIRIILSWLPHNRYHPAISFIYRMTEPILEPFRNMINPIGGIDLSPVIVFILLRLVQNYLISYLISI